MTEKGAEEQVLAMERLRLTFTNFLLDSSRVFHV